MRKHFQSFPDIVQLPAFCTGTKAFMEVQEFIFHYQRLKKALFPFLVVTQKAVSEWMKR